MSLVWFDPDAGILLMMMQAPVKMQNYLTYENEFSLLLVSLPSVVKLSTTSQTVVPAPVPSLLLRHQV